MEIGIIRVTGEKEIRELFDGFIYDFYELCKIPRDELERYLKKIVKNADVYVAYVKKKPVGIISFYCNDEKNKYGYLTNFAIKEKYRGKGIGSLLLEILETQCKKKGIEKVGLEVNINNHVAIGIYKKRGFKEVEYRGGKVIYMVKNLKELENM